MTESEIGPIASLPLRFQAEGDPVVTQDCDGAGTFQMTEGEQQYDEHVWAWRAYRASLFGLHAFIFSLKQERLGPQFEDVLYENLWDLYAR